MTSAIMNSAIAAAIIIAAAIKSERLGCTAVMATVTNPRMISIQAKIAHRWANFFFFFLFMTRLFSCGLQFTKMFVEKIKRVVKKCRNR